MSTTYSIGIIPNGEAPIVVEHIVHRMLKASKLLEVTQYENWDFGKETKFPVNMSSEAWLLLLSQILASADRLVAELHYICATQRLLPISLIIYGEKFSSGNRVKNHGYCRPVFDSDDLYQPVWGFLKEAGVTGDLFQIEHWHELDATLRKQVQTILDKLSTDEEELFLRVCGLFDTASGCSDIEHASIYEEGRWQSPVVSSAVFHRDTAQFGQDFIRIWLEYKFGINTMDTYALGLDPWLLKPSTQKQLDNATILRISDGYLPYDLTGSDDIAQFLDSLTEQKVRRLAMLSGETIRSILLQMAAEQSSLNDRPESHISIRDFGKCGLSLLTLPKRSSLQAKSPMVSSVWPAYKYIANCVL